MRRRIGDHRGTGMVDAQAEQVMKKAVGILLLFILGGCASNTDSTAKLPPPPPSVAPAPKYSATPIDSKLHAQAARELILETASPDPFMRCNAIEALSDVDPSDADDAIMKGLSDSEPAVRFASAMAAGQLKLVDAYGKLRSMTGDQDLQVQTGVRFALHRLGDTRLSHDLEKFAASPDPHLRGTVAMVLGLLKDPSATKMLVTLLSDRVPSVRLQAAEALWRLGDERGLVDLVAYSISAYPDDQMIALQALAETGDQRVIQHIRGELTNDYVEVSLAAARGLGMLGSDEGWNIAVPAAKSKDPRQRSLAALAMGSIGRTDLQPYLADLLKDPEASVRISAATGILQLRPQGVSNAN
jgi:HEAT repeat protein